MGAGVDPGLGRWNQTLDAAKSYPKVESVPGLTWARFAVSVLTIGLGCVRDLGGDCGGRGVDGPEVLKGSAPGRLRKFETRASATNNELN